MLLQTNSYVVPREKRAEHARLMLRFRQCFRRLGSVFEVYEQTGANFTGDGAGRFVQIMRFRDRHHQQEVQEKEQNDAVAQQLIADFCQLVNLSYQQQHGLYSASYYAGILHDRPTDKPELLVTDESGETDDSSPDEADEKAPIPTMRQPTVEEAFAPFLEPEPPEYDVQQTEPDDQSAMDEPQGSAAPRRRHHRPASPRGAQ